ncbi:MAG: glycosyltransferase family 4 protein [Nitrospinae bacterium]|nr:glycosyltransferase family 4 protein [Nitrospinota bacterium]MBL7020010.1 glycosyltransferase family 4 protein [Nitrospinaceae bacterium]
MKTLHILHSEAAPGWGGQEIRVFQECQLLLERGHRVSIVCPPDSPLGDRCRRLSHPNLSYSPLAMKRAFSLSTLFSLIKIIKNSQPDILHSHSSIDSWLIAMAGKILSVPIIRSRHVMIPIKNHIFNRWLYAKVPRRVLTTGIGIAKMVSENVGVSTEKIISIPTGVDFRKFDFQICGKKIRAELEVESYQPLIGMVAVMRSWKGHDYFVDSVPLVLEKFPDARFVIVGDGPAYERILSKVQQLGLEKVIFMLGHREDIPEIMAALDILCLASFAVEGAAQVIPQAFAMKTPVVSTRISSIPPILGNGKWGILIEPKNSQDLANGSMKFLNDLRLAQSMAEKAYIFCKNELSADKMMDQTIAVYHDVLKDCSS